MVCQDLKKAVGDSILVGTKRWVPNLGWFVWDGQEWLPIGLVDHKLPHKKSPLRKKKGEAKSTEQVVLSIGKRKKTDYLF